MTTKQDAIRLFQIGDDLAQEFVAKAQGISTSTCADPTYCRAQLFFFAKGYKSFRAMEVLWCNGFWQDALTLLRTIFEASLQARYLSSDREALMPLFGDYEVVAKCRVLRKVRKMNLECWDSRAEASFGRLERTCASLESKYPKDKPGWHGMKISRLAETVGNPYKDTYPTAYAFQSCFVHSDIFIASSYLDWTEGHLKVKCGPEESDELEGPADATHHILQLTTLAADALAMDIGDTVKSAFGRWKTETDKVMASRAIVLDRMLQE